MKVSDFLMVAGLVLAVIASIPTLISLANAPTACGNLYPGADPADVAKIKCKDQ